MFSKQRGFRFKEQHISQAIVQKLALLQSALRAAQVLLKHGHTMEQGMLHRVIDELNEDIQFLTYGMVRGELTPLHQRYLAAFWAEEFTDVENPTKSHQSRDMIPRKKIRAYLAMVEGGTNPSDALQDAKLIAKGYSGFVHGASPQIMESFGGNPPCFHTRGLLDSPRIPEYTRELWNYMFRGFHSHIIVAHAFGDNNCAEVLYKHLRRFESLAGVDYSKDGEIAH